MSLSLYYILQLFIMYSLKTLFGVGSLWYIMNGLINAAIISMFLLYLVAFVQTQIKQKWFRNESLIALMLIQSKQK